MTAGTVSAPSEMALQTAGTERLRILSGGQVAIGTVTEGRTDSDELTLGGAGDVGLTIRSGTSNFGNIYFSDATSGTAEYAGYVQYNHSTNDLIFGSNSSEGLRITSEGELQAQRDYDAVGVNTFAKFTRTGGGGPELEIGYNAITSDYGYFGTGSAHDLGLRTNDTTRLRILSGGQVAIGTVTEGHTSADDLTVATVGGTPDHAGITIRSADNKNGSLFFSDATSGAGEYDGWIQYTHGTSPYMTVATNQNERLRITSNGGFSFNNAELVEKVKITAGKLSDNTNINLVDGMVHYFSTTETGTSTPNIRIDGSNTLNNAMDTGDVITVTLITTAAAAAYSAALNIDGSSATVEWSGAAAPSAGGASGLDVHAYTIIKTGSGAYKVLGNYTNFD